MHTLDNKVLKVEISTPDNLNALCQETIEKLEFLTSSFYETEKKNIHVIWITPISVVTKERKIALSGGDLKTIYSHRHSKKKFSDYFVRVQKLCQTLADLPVPVIMSVDGYLAGGGVEFFSCADLRFATIGSSFHFKQLDNGIFSGFGGCTRLSKLVGVAATQKWLLTGSKVGSSEAKSQLLVHETYADSEEMDAAISEVCSNFRSHSIEQIQTQKKMLSLVIKAHEKAETRELELTKNNIHQPNFISFLESFHDRS